MALQRLLTLCNTLLSVHPTFTLSSLFAALLVCLLSTGAAAQAPCLPGWTYRVPVAVDNRGGAVPLGGHQVLVVLNTQALVAQHKAKADGSDLRFLDKAGSVLPYWIENGN